jgi:preprotein translocase subunit SecF
MEFFRFKRDIPFMKYALFFNAISLITFLIAVGALGYKGLHYGIDFTGGTVAELRYAKTADLGQARTAVEALKTGEAVVQNFGTPQDVLVRLPIIPGVTALKRSNSSASSSSARRLAKNCLRAVHWRYCW